VKPWHFFALAFTLVGCASSQPIEFSDQRDFLGNPFPVECLDLSDVHPHIRYVSEDTLRVLENASDWDTKRGYYIFGAWHDDTRNSPDGEVYISNELTPQRELETLRHEYCHAKMRKVRGDARWHR